MSCIKDNVFEIVTELVMNKRGKVVPDTITLVEFMKEIKNSLNELYNEGKINVGNTINDKYIRLK